MKNISITMEDVIDRAERNICIALEDYCRHIGPTEALENVSDIFIRTLASDSSYAKQGLRELFRKSPSWDEELDAIVLNGTRTHDPDPEVIGDLISKIFRDYPDHRVVFEIFRRFVLWNSISEQCREELNKIVPDAYASGKKPSRVFKALCKGLGVADETKGSEFQKMYAQLADELSSRKLGFKLFVSINPAHFLTMSNPHDDDRGETLVSCHSLNCTDYEYNVGCTGYARDKVSFIVFTVTDPDDRESLNNRKTTRQIFAYQPGNGVLLQSRLYDTQGGTRGAQEDSKLYRDLIQRELSQLEGAVNLWKTFRFCERKDCVYTGEGFGGYADWTEPDFNAKISIRQDHQDDYQPLEVGSFGLCFQCGCEIFEGLLCEKCADGDGDESYCDDCDYRCDEDQLSTVYDTDGNERRVCDDCRSAYYTQCDDCGGWFADEAITHVEGGLWVECPDCLARHYFQCGCCGEYIRKPDDGSSLPVATVTLPGGQTVEVCDDCAENYIRCSHCGERIVSTVYGQTYCPSCGCVLEKQEQEVTA